MYARVKMEEAATYHVMSRIVERNYRLTDGEREIFRRIMRASETFSGVQVLTYALMANHFHILVHVPERREVPEEEVVGRCEALYGRKETRQMTEQWEVWRRTGNDVLVVQQLAKLRARMYDISQFMKTLKLRYTISYNARNNRTDPLWNGRFRSVMVENDGPALGVMAAYIDLNPVRSGQVEDPKDYCWCGYGEACAGNKTAREGLSCILGRVGAGIEPAGDPLARYRVHLYCEGAARETGMRRGFTREEIEKVLKAGGKLGRFNLLCCRLRYLHDGVAIGGRAFVETVFRANRHAFGPKRRTGARPVHLADLAGIYTARDLRKDLVVPSA